jgi:Na+/H+ antiporter NhaC
MKARLFARRFLVLGCLVLSALVLAALSIRLPATWPYFPGWVNELLVFLVAPSNQEQLADVEFLGLWLTCLVVLGICSLAVHWAAKYIGPKQGKRHAA